MACNPVTYHGVSPTVFKCLKNKLKAEGVDLPSGESGTLSGHGVTADFTWSKSAATLTITVTDKPFYITCGYLSGIIHDNVIGCGGE